MRKKIIKLTAGGIAWGCLIATIINMLGSTVQGSDWFAAMKYGYAGNAIAAMIVGIGWVLPSLVYDSERLPMGIKVLIHMGIGFTTYFICAFGSGWMPINLGRGALITTIILLLLVGALIWLCFYIYYKKEAAEINHKINEMHH